nr:G protein-coupled receptor [Proales similis]
MVCHNPEMQSPTSAKASSTCPPLEEPMVQIKHRGGRGDSQTGQVESSWPSNDSKMPQNQTKRVKYAETELLPPMPDQEATEEDGLLTVPVDLLYVPKNCAEQVELFAKYVWESGWRVMPHHALPNWLRDNDFLLKGHRPPLPSIKECFLSIFRIHTETGNIWTHFIGAFAFIVIAVYFFTRPDMEIKIQEKIVFGTFFMGAIICLLCSALFHTFYCYSPTVCKVFNKIDYCGISVLTMGSFVPWLYYAFYCESVPKIAYLILIGVLGTSCIVVSLWDKFSEPRFRAVRAGMFIALGLSGIIPAIHYIATFGSVKAFNVGALGWLILMAVLYIIGACLYAARIPERLFPGRFDIWFQSHQIFHIFVVAAAYVHYHGITKLASYRLTMGDCLNTYTESDYAFEF